MNSSIETSTRAMPVVISTRPPTNAINLPAIGEITTIGAVSGKINSPASTGE